MQGGARRVQPVARGQGPLASPPVRAALDTLPLVAAGPIDFELIPLAPYPGCARLFADAALEPDQEDRHA